MKTFLILTAATLATISYVQLGAQNAKPPATGTTLAYPYNAECIITLDPRAERPDLSATQAAPAGFQPDGTLRGQLIYMSDEWCVLKDGSFENWVPRDKVLTMRASK
ncbi:hypothetical protein OJ996_00380 [Luteolibacter sp. GHJ8]|jgi:hypothetical protein|uniref:SH3 domain-containing protein n=1 Tax=Luteolibacter rhizosphaerae TaxID=2989719 RepID=A0ABT3FXE1_9BACT|nr:hypothetical protein [Luteolibacter rhizosphaerae]MCW1912009.1 hypothetical protein [Luteolibacter rhizosphaerae]